MTPSLSLLPAEVVEYVASGLSAIDLKNLRLTCRTLKEKAARPFGEVCLSSFVTDLSLESVGELEELSTHDQLRHYVRTLIISEKPGLECRGLGRGFTWNRHHDGHLVHPIPILPRLKHILSTRLWNCRSFRICSVYSVEEEYASDYILPTDAVSLTITVITTAQLPVHAFIFDFQQIATNSLDTKRLEPSQRNDSLSVLSSTWPHLHELRLCHWVDLSILDWTLNLVSTARSLRRLSLHLPYLGHLEIRSPELPESRTDSFLSQLLRRSDPSEPFPKLEDLTFIGMGFNFPEISRFAGGARTTLRAISLQRIYLEDDADAWWMSTIRFMRKNLVKLENVHLEMLREGYPPNQKLVSFPALAGDPAIPGLAGQKVGLRERRKKGQMRVVGVWYQGPRMDLALGLVENSVVLF